MTLDVLVVGAGPTGLAMACELARRGLSVRIVDKAPEPTQLSKAIGVHARTMEILDDMGIAQEMIRRGVTLGRVRLMSGGKTLVEAAFDELDTRFPFLLSIPQRDTEAILAELLAKRGGRVEREAELVDLVQEGERVRATLRHPASRSEEVETSWLIGCDGAHSTVRKSVGLAFEGEAFEEPFLLADVRIDWELSRDEVVTFFSDRGLVACFPLPGGRWRLIATGDPDQDDRIPTLEDFQTIVDERTGVRARLSDGTWFSRFRIHTRQVARYRAGRVFLAGDAAHIHSPVGGQGMNTGIQDAHNLAWKLALVARGAGRPSLLDSYQVERHAIGRGVLAATAFATRVATLRNPVARAIRDRVSSFLSSLEVIQQRLTRGVAELDLSYRKSPIVEEDRVGLLGARLGSGASDESPNVVAWKRFGAAPAAGDRAPDLGRLYDGLRHTLLLFDGAAQTEEGYRNLSAIACEVRARLGAYVTTHVVLASPNRPASLDWDGSVVCDTDGELEDRFGAVSECLYLIRPDLYVGYRAQPADGGKLLAYLTRVLNEPTTTATTKRGPS